MAYEERRRSSPPSAGPFLAEVTSHLDPIYMGRLEVALIKNMPSRIKEQSETYIASYCSPFMGSTSIRYEGNNSSDFNDVMKSYGFWAIPPDIGNTVMVMFIDGDANQCYWFGCVQEPFQNHMIPGIAASRSVGVTDEQRRKYGTDLLPVAEVHKSSVKEGVSLSGKAKPVHPFAERLLQQGLLVDTVRGVTSSSARREVPSGVFGISTPGPLDTSSGSKRGNIGYGAGTEAPVSRLGGSTFVMDDGDVNGQNELVRIRTRTGHQILMHNSQDLIYIANSKGTAWIEMTSNGKIDIYAHDSVSIHSEHDFNFRADRDINLEAGRNIHISANKNMETNVTGFYHLTVDANSKISVRGTQDHSVSETAKFTVGGNYETLLGKNFIVSADGGIDLGGESHVKIGSAAALNLGANGNVLVSGSRIDLNGPAAAAPAAASQAEAPPDLPLFTLPNRKISAGWSGSKFYKADDIKSIMQRVPTHEPWPQHENINPQQFSPQATDITMSDRSKAGVAPNPASAAGGAPNPQETANPPAVAAGTCSPEYAKEINARAAQTGIAALKKAAAEMGLTTPYAVASLLGVAGGESHWEIVEEKFGYSAARLLEVVPSVFKGDQALAQQYAGNPNNSLPEFLYGYQTAKGKGLGNTEPGDGGKFIGRGYIGLTGRANYTNFSKWMYEAGKLPTPTALVDNPKLINDSKVAAEVSVLYFLKLVKTPQTDPGYFEAAYRRVGFCTKDIYTRKKGYYECFLAQLQGAAVSSGSGGIVVDGSGNPVKTGSAK